MIREERVARFIKTRDGHFVNMSLMVQIKIIRVHENRWDVELWGDDNGFWLYDICETEYKARMRAQELCELVN